MAAVILAGDVGGTKTHLGIFRVDGQTLTPIRDELYRTRDFKGLADACLDFLARGGEKIDRACFGVPGPVIESQAHATNVPWEMREDALKESLNGIRVRLINDLGATAYGVIHLDSSQVRVLQRGQYQLHCADIAVLAAGTGLGEAALVHEDGRYYAVASEGGHCDFAPRNEEQVELWKFLHHEFGHVSVERVLSGPGLVNIYRFVRAKSPDSEPDWLRAMMQSRDAGEAVSEAALERRDPECVHAMEIFVDIYGAEAGNLALKVLALGGVYLGGGIAPKILPALTDGRFIRAFNDKGRLGEILGRIEVRVSLNQSAALIGAAHCAAAML